MAEDHVINRIEELEKTTGNILEHISKLAVQTERVAVASEVLTEAMSRQYTHNRKVEDLATHIATIEERLMRQYEDNKAISQLPSRVISLESSMSIVNKVGGTILTVGLGMVMVFLFQSYFPMMP